MKIIQDRQNDLLKRREVKVVVESSNNPSIDEAKKIVVDEFKVGEGGISIKKVAGKFGRKTFLIVANIYKSKEDKDKAEPKTKKQLEAEKKAEEAKKEEEKKAAEKTIEQPAESAQQTEENKEEVNNKEQ